VWNAPVKEWRGRTMKSTVSLLMAVVGSWIVVTSPAAAQPAAGEGTGKVQGMQPGPSRGAAGGLGEPLYGIERFAEPESSRERREGEGEREGEEEKEEPVESDRDAFTPQTKTVGKGLFILESSYTFLDHKDTADTHSFPE